MLDNYSDTSDLVGYNGDEVKIVLTTYANGNITPLGREALSWINPSERLINGFIEDRNIQLQGDGVIRTKINDLASKVYELLSKKEALNALFWRFVLRHPESVPKEFAISGLHEEAINYIFAEGKKRFGYGTAMGVHPLSVDCGPSGMMAWCVDELGNGSDANGRRSLGLNYGRLIGLSPEAARSLSEISYQTEAERK